MKVTLSEVLQKHLKIVAYLLGSGATAFALSYYVLKDEKLTVLLAPVLNYIAWAIEKELANEGVRKALSGK